MKRKVAYSFMVLLILSGWIFIGYNLKDLMEGKTVQIEAPTDFADRSMPMFVDIAMEPQKITIGMIGDLLLHNPLYTYENYDFAFAGVRNKMTEIDFLLANQESMPGGVELGLSGYPSFNSPKHIIRDLKANGVNMLSIANNHTIDRKEAGLLKAIGHMKEYGMPYVGAYTSMEDREKNRIVKVNGIRIGVLAYTYGTNGNPIPRGKSYLVSLIERERMQEEIEHLSQQVDVIVVSMHWGNEYELLPSQMQEELAQFVADAGADIIFGHHPHVLQRYDEVGRAKVFYSLGNFYSAQQFDSTNIGGIARVSINYMDFAGKRYVETGMAAFYPTAVKRDAHRRFVVVPLKDAGADALYSEDWVKKHVGVDSW